MADDVSHRKVSADSINQNKAPEKVELDTLITEFAQDYSKYLKVDITAEKALLEDETEEILTRLDEFTSLVDMVRGDNAQCLNQILPEIHKKCAEMESLFTKIDRLEDLMTVIKQNLDVMEEKVSKAEEHLDTSSVKKLFNTFQKPLFSKKPPEPKKLVVFEAPEIFKTEDFFLNTSASGQIDPAT